MEVGDERCFGLRVPEELSQARAELHQRWYDEGYYGHGTMTDFMRRGAEQNADVELIFHSEQRPDRATIGEMWQRAHLIAGNLQALGVAPGDVVAIQTPSWLEGVLTFEAAMLCGAVVVPVIHIYGPAEVGFILRQSGASMLVVPDRWGKIDFLERLAALDDVPDLRHTVVIGDRVPDGAIPWDDLAVDRGNTFAAPDAPGGRRVPARLHVGHDGGPEGCAAHPQHARSRVPDQAVRHPGADRHGRCSRPGTSPGR